MCLIQEGDVVVRAYPLSERSLVREDGKVIELLAGSAQERPALRLGGECGRRPAENRPLSRARGQFRGRRGDAVRHAVRAC